MFLVSILPPAPIAAQTPAPSPTLCPIVFRPFTTPLSDRTEDYIYFSDYHYPQQVVPQTLAPGLYPNRTHQAPQDHRQTGQTIAQTQITPLNALGQPDPGGKIGLISIGMSNTRQAFSGFIGQLNDLNSLNPAVVVANTALNGMVADNWNDPEDIPWQTLNNRLSGLTRAQVQVVWIKVTLAGPQTYPDHLDYLYQRLIEIVHTAKAEGQLPQLKLAIISSRTRSYHINLPGTSQQGLSSEPYAFQDAFAVRRLIGDQIASPQGILNLNSTPFLTWGPYLWIDGENPRSDGRRWTVNDISCDLVHPSEAGMAKVGDQLLAFFANSPITQPWFLDPARRGSPLTINPSPNPARTGETVNFSLSAPAGSRVYWLFDDGTTGSTAATQKYFALPGTYQVRAVAVEPSGTYHSAELPFVVQAPAPTSVLPPGDPDGDGDTDWLDYLYLLTRLNSPYTIFDINSLIRTQ